jgi:hypothetical protein
VANQELRRFIAPEGLQESTQGFNGFNLVETWAKFSCPSKNHPQRERFPLLKFGISVVKEIEQNKRNCTEWKDLQKTMDVLFVRFHFATVTCVGYVPKDRCPMREKG